MKIKLIVFFIAIFLCFDAFGQNEKVDTLMISASNGDAKAQYNLGRIYHKGEGVPIDKKKAFEWYSKSADLGNNNAMYSLATMYYFGEGVPIDKEKASHWDMKSAEHGNNKAQLAVGDMYYSGDGVSVDKKKAFQWYKKSAEQGNANAQLNLGKIYYLNKKNTPINNEEAFNWFYKSAEQGNSEAMHSLGTMYYYGEGVIANLKRAAFWIKKSKESGFENANKFWDKFELWKFDAFKQKENFDSVIVHAKNGDAEAQNLIGDFYFCGNGRLSKKHC